VSTTSSMQKLHRKCMKKFGWETSREGPRRKRKDNIKMNLREIVS
jgi:hypothetical protein